jgi:hypothetical protein
MEHPVGDDTGRRGASPPHAVSVALDFEAFFPSRLGSLVCIQSRGLGLECYQHHAESGHSPPKPHRQTIQAAGALQSLCRVLSRSDNVALGAAARCLSGLVYVSLQILLTHLNQPSFRLSLAQTHGPRAAEPAMLHRPSGGRPRQQG